MRFSCICLATLLLVGNAGGDGSAGKYHEDERWGYKVRVPDGWITAALSADEEWIASKHLAEKELVAKKGLWFADSRPEMWVIGFPHERQDQRGTRFGKDEKDAKSAREDEEKIFFNNPYRDYKDFLKRERWFAEGGYFFSEEKEDEVAGMKVTMYEIKVDKMVDSPIRIFTWVYHFDDIDFAIQFKILEDHVRTHEQGFKACLKSFRRVDRTRALPGTATTGGDKVIEDVDESKLTTEERARHRKEKVEQQYRREIDGLPKGWYHFSSDHYLVLANASKKYTNDLVRHAEAVREYLDETFGSLGIDYVPPAILRVFATYPEYEAYAQGTQRFFGSGARQVLVVEGNNPESINDNLTWQWLDFKNEDLYSSMPDWISTGLSQHMSFCRSQGKKVKFVFDEWDQEKLKTLLDKKEEIPLKELISGAHEKKNEGVGMEIDMDKLMKMSRESTQAGSVVTYLLTTGNKGKTKDALSRYLAALVVALEGAQAELKDEMAKVEAQATDAAESEAAEDASSAGEEEGGAGEDASSEDDEEEGEEDEEKRLQEQERLMKAVREAMAKKRDTLREKAFAAGFGHLTDKDWKSIDAAWKRFVK
jgi:hypothetical protein